MEELVEWSLGLWSREYPIVQRTTALIQEIEGNPHLRILYYLVVNIAGWKT